MLITIFFTFVLKLAERQLSEIVCFTKTNNTPEWNLINSDDLVADIQSKFPDGSQKCLCFYGGGFLPERH